MKIEHLGIFTDQIEVLKNYYTRYFGATSNKMYCNEAKQFRSYFLSFDSGARIELMSMPEIPENKNDTKIKQHKGLIHFAFELESMQEVDNKSKELTKDGFLIIDGPRKTGDGYYEFVTLDPDSNRIEITTKYAENFN
jgi:lactoylglutathione lyase